MSVVVIGRLMKSSANVHDPAFAPLTSRTLTWLPGTSRRCPSVTTESPASSPCLITVSAPASARDRDRPQLDGLVRFDDVHVVAVRPRLNGRRRHNDGGRLGGQPDDNVGELSWPECPVFVGKRALDFDRSRRLIDDVVHEGDAADGARAGWVVGQPRLHLKRPAGHETPQVRQHRLGECERDIHRRHLIDGDERRLIVGAHEIAGRHHQCAGSTADRRANGGVLQLHLGVFNRGAIGRQCGLERGDLRARRVARLTRDNAALCQLLLPLQNRLRVRGRGRIALECGGRLQQRRFERSAVQREELLPLLHVVTLLEFDGGELAGDLGADGHRRIRLDRADHADLERHVLLDGSRGRDGHCRRGRILLRLKVLAFGTCPGGDRRSYHQAKNETGRQTHRVIRPQAIDARLLPHS